MRKAILALALLALAALTPGAAQSGGRKIALVIGCNGYKNGWGLDAPKLDAENLARKLAADGYRVWLMTDAARGLGGEFDVNKFYPSKANIEDRAKILFPTTGTLGPDDTILFYFAGHGFHWGGVDYLAPLDARLPENRTAALPKAELLPFGDIQRQMHESGAGSVILITDACRTDENEVRGGERRVDQGFGAKIEVEIRGGQDQRIALFRSCRQGQAAVADKARGGYFTQALAEGLDGLRADANHDGMLTIDELNEYTNRQVEAKLQDAGFKTTEHEPDLLLAGNPRRQVVVAGRTGGGIKAVALKARLRIVTMPDGATVVMDGREVGTTPFDQEYDLAEPLRKVRVELRKEGYLPVAYDVPLTRGLPQLLDNVELRRVPVPTPTPSQPAPTPTPAPAPPSGGRPANWPDYLSSYQPPAGMSWSSFRVSPKDGMPQVLIPAGEFQMGSPAKEWGGNDEHPRKKVYVSAFWMDLHEVTHEQYGRFVRAASYKPSPNWEKWSWQMSPRQPAVYVSWDDASAYATWAGRELPTEAEWEKAARGGTTTVYPWGDQANPALANGDWKHDRHWTEMTRLGYMKPVGSYPANRFGLVDMIGNVAEWCRDWYDEGWYGRMPGKDPVNTTQSSIRVCRGGSWESHPVELRVAGRVWHTPDFRIHTLGFRCSEAP